MRRVLRSRAMSRLFYFCNHKHNSLTVGVVKRYPKGVVSTPIRNNRISAAGVLVIALLGGRRGRISTSMIGLFRLVWRTRLATLCVGLYASTTAAYEISFYCGNSLYTPIQLLAAESSASWHQNSELDRIVDI